MHRTAQIRKIRSRRAFTLIEMLVAVALISILMLMFAQIFSLASDIFRQQRGIATNDQTERMLRTIIRNDLERRSYRSLIPLESTSTPSEEGYFYIDEGDVNNDTDDILQFTIDTKSGNTDSDVEPLYGHAETFSTDFLTHPDQPDFDDDIITPNQTGAARFGELVYFLRNGNLYRRILLIRDRDDGADYGPEDGTGTQLIPGAYTGNFWTDFDYSAAFDTNAGSFIFLGRDHLLNDRLASIPSFGIPRFRFGFCPSFNDVSEGIPRRTVTSGSFIGRFTQRETSDPSFAYPVTNTPTNPLYPGVPLTYNPANGVVNEFSSGTRYADDILLTNVHSFDIKVWDPGFFLGPDGQPGIAGVNDDGDKNGTIDNIEELGALGSDDWYGPDGQPGFAGIDDDGVNGVDDSGEVGWPGSDDADPRRFLDLGHGLAGTGSPFYYFNSSANTPAGNCYDTWHPHASVGSVTTIPFNPKLFTVGPDGQPGVAGIDDDGINGIDDFGELGTPSSDDVFVSQVPLKMIRIHIRYVDQKSDQMRDVIIVHSLTD